MAGARGSGADYSVERVSQAIREWYGDPSQRPRLLLARAWCDDEHLSDQRGWVDCRTCLTPWFRFQAPLSCQICHKWPKTLAEARRERLKAKRVGLSPYELAQKRRRKGA